MEDKKDEELRKEESLAADLKTEEPKPEEPTGEDLLPETEASAAETEHQTVNLEEAADQFQADAMAAAASSGADQEALKKHSEEQEAAEAEEARILKKKKHKKTAVIVTVVLVCVLLLTAGGVYCYMAQYYGSHFYTGTVINGTDVSGETVDQVKDYIKKQIAEYSLTIEERDGVTETLSSDDVGWAYADDKKVEIGRAHV